MWAAAGLTTMQRAVFCDGSEITGHRDEAWTRHKERHCSTIEWFKTRQRSYADRWDWQAMARERAHVDVLRALKCGGRAGAP